VTRASDPARRSFDLRPGVEGAAQFSPDRTRRYVLRRRWEGGGAGTVVFIGLNPSTADERRDDHTVRTCWLRALEWGYDALVLVNLYAFVATDPRDLRRDAGGERGNEEWIIRHAAAADRVLAVWGSPRTAADRAHACRISELLAAQGVELFCLARNRDGSPRHPRGVVRGAAPAPYAPSCA
jgi:hypothetical protein